jgi:hypothetical protein
MTDTDNTGDVENCEHTDADWDWGEVRPADNYVVVPGYCSSCDSEVYRHYILDTISESY